MAGVVVVSGSVAARVGVEGQMLMVQVLTVGGCLVGLVAVVGLVVAHVKAGGQ